ncbi:MAG: hypothetical protein OEZ43_11510 [Gammaproteobacteria bacterium]|nr:hypothetical protein [Gammaproteobacteria bacterium]
MSKGKAKPIHYGPLNIDLPENPTSISTSGIDGKLVITFTGKTEADYSQLMNMDFSKSQFRLADKARIQYGALKAAKNALNEQDQAFWNRHLQNRHALFSEKSRLFITGHSGLTVYYSNERPQWWSAQAIITLDELPDRLITLTLWGRDIGFLESVIAGIKIKK